MKHQNYHAVPQAALNGSMRDFRVPTGRDLIGRIDGFYKWQDVRRQNGVWPFSRATHERPAAICEALDDSGNPMPASQVLQELMGDQWYMERLSWHNTVEAHRGDGP